MQCVQATTGFCKQRSEISFDLTWAIKNFLKGKSDCVDVTLFGSLQKDRVGIGNFYIHVNLLTECIDALESQVKVK